MARQIPSLHVRRCSTHGARGRNAGLVGDGHRQNPSPANPWPVPQQVDYRLMGSAMARVRWELDVNPRWQRDPVFYVEQTIGPLQEELMSPRPFNEARCREIV